MLADFASIFFFFFLWRIWIYLYRYLRLISFEIIIIVIITRKQYYVKSYKSTTRKKAIELIFNSVCSASFYNEQSGVDKFSLFFPSRSKYILFARHFAYTLLPISPGFCSRSRSKNWKHWLTSFYRVERRGVWKVQS